MSPRHWINLGLVAGAGALVGLGLLPQRQSLADLRSRVRQAQAEPARTPPTVRSPGPASALNPAGPGELTQAEKLEQARLRAEVGRLKDRQRALAGVVEENHRLRIAAAPADAGKPSEQPPLPAGYIRRAQARLQGYDTPQHTLESFFWAIQQKDTNALFAAVHPDSAASLAAQLERQGTDEGFREFARVPGFAVSREESTGDEDVTLWLLFAPDTPAIEMKLQRVDNQWRLRM